MKVNFIKLSDFLTDMRSDNNAIVGVREKVLREYAITSEKALKEIDRLSSENRNLRVKVKYLEDKISSLEFAETSLDVVDLLA